MVSKKLRMKALKVVLFRTDPENAFKITKKLINDQDADMREAYLKQITTMLPLHYSTQKVVYDSICAQYVNQVGQQPR